MTLSRTIQTLTKRYPLAGPACWILSLQYFIVQFAAALAWTAPYSWFHNTISDLGNTACGIYSNRYVCSPLHVLMNASFILLGVTMVAGAVLIYYELLPKLKRRKSAFVGFCCLALAGLGTVVVGFFPENSVWGLHIIGASLPFLIGNLGLVVLGIALPLPRGLRVYTVLSGVITLITLILLITNHHLGLGLGGMERITAYVQTIWLIVFGLYMTKSRPLSFSHLP